MTEAQIKRKAKTYSKNYWYNTNNSVNVASIEKLLVDFTIEATKELQEENKDIQQSCENYYNEMRSYKNKVAELEAQIEKMKCWCNCKNYQKCLIELAEQGKRMNSKECCVNCKKWEIKEK